MPMAALPVAQRLTEGKTSADLLINITPNRIIFEIETCRGYTLYIHGRFFDKDVIIWGKTVIALRKQR